MNIKIKRTGFGVITGFGFTAIFYLILKDLFPIGRNYLIMGLLLSVVFALLFNLKKETLNSKSLLRITVLVLVLIFVALIALAGWAFSGGIND